MSKSFYDLDYIIELNEKRLAEYIALCNRAIDKYGIPIIIYSSISIFLVPIVEHIIEGDITIWAYHVAFLLFAITLLFSLFWFLRLLIPANIAYAKPPTEYYTTYRTNYENRLPLSVSENVIDNMIKGTYIIELQQAIVNNERVYERKSTFYFNALIYGLLCTLPYLVCLGCHFAKKENKTYKVELVKK